MLKHEERVNTYKPEDFFKIVILSPNEKTSEDKALWLSNTDAKKISPTGTYKTIFNKTNIVFYSRWPGSNREIVQATVSVDAILIFVDNEDEWNVVLKEVEKKYKFLSVVLIVTDSDRVRKFERDLNFASSISKNSSSQQIFDKLDDLDREEYKKIQSIIEKFDTDKSGFLEIKETPNLVKSLGDDPNSKEIKEALLALDINHDNILQIDEFIQWWKIGRQNHLALSKIYELNQKCSRVINNLVNFNNFQRISEKQTKDIKNELNVNVNTKNFDEYLTRLYFRFTTGGEKRKEATKNFLSKFTNVLENHDDNWIYISIFVQSLTFKGNEIKGWLEKFRENLIKYAEQNLIPGLSNFIKDFVNFHFYPQDYSATITFEFKSDVYSLLKDALCDFMFIKNFLTNNGKEFFDFDLRIHSGANLGDIISNSQTLGDFLEKSEISIESSAIKDRIRTLLTNLNDQYKPYMNLLQFLFACNKMKLNYTGPINEFLDSQSDGIKNIQLGFLNPILQFIRENINKELLNCMTRLDIGMNLHDVFMNVQIFSENLWAQKP